jgi:6-phosphogluconolactonase
MRIETLPDSPALARHVAEWMTSQVEVATSIFRVSLSGGSTPKALYTPLASDSFRDRFPWSRVAWSLGRRALRSR